jgi:hypothetical protein
VVGVVNVEVFSNGAVVIVYVDATVVDGVPLELEEPRQPNSSNPATTASNNIGFPEGM